MVERSILVSNSFDFGLVTVEKSLFTGETWPPAGKKGGHAFRLLSAVSQATEVRMPSNLVQQSPAIVERSILDSNSFGFDLLTVKKSLFTGETWSPSRGGSFSTSFSYFSGYRCQNALKIGATKPRDCRKIDFRLEQFWF